MNLFPARISARTQIPQLARLLGIVSLVAFGGVFGGGIGCGGGDDGGAQAQAKGRGGAGGAAGGAEARPAGPPIPVATAAAESGSIASYYQATSSLEANREAQILARVSGVVRAIPVEEGDAVQRGQSLIRIEPEEYELRVRQAEAERDKQHTRFERLEKMWNQNLVSAEDYEAGKNDLAASEAAVDLAKLELSYAQVPAPFSGRVVQRMVEVGRTVSNGTPLFVLSDLSKLLARVHVPAKEFRSLKTDQEVELRLDSDGTALTGVISLISPVIDAATGTIKVTVEIADVPPGVRPGDFASVNIVTERRNDTLLVPKIAVVTDQTERVVYVAADSTAERRVVEVGFEDSEFAEILSGLAEGDDVIVQGQRSLKHGQPIKRMEPLVFDKPKRLQQQSS